MEVIKIIGYPSFTFTGDSYSASVPVVSQNDNGWLIAETMLTVTGLITDTPFASSFISKLKTQITTWQTKLSIERALKAELSGLVGKVIS